MQNTSLPTEGYHQRFYIDKDQVKLIESKKIGWINKIEGKTNLYRVFRLIDRDIKKLTPEQAQDFKNRVDKIAKAYEDNAKHSVILRIRNFFLNLFGLNLKERCTALSEKLQNNLQLTSSQTNTEILLYENYEKKANTYLDNYDYNALDGILNDDPQDFNKKYFKDLIEGEKGFHLLTLDVNMRPNIKKLVFDYAIDVDKFKRVPKSSELIYHCLVNGSDDLFKYLTNEDQIEQALVNFKEDEFSADRLISLINNYWCGKYLFEKNLISEKSLEKIFKFQKVGEIQISKIYETLIDRSRYSFLGLYLSYSYKESGETKKLAQTIKDVFIYAYHRFKVFELERAVNKKCSFEYALFIFNSKSSISESCADFPRNDHVLFELLTKQLNKARIDSIELIKELKSDKKSIQTESLLNEYPSKPWLNSSNIVHDYLVKNIGDADECFKSGTLNAFVENLKKPLNILDTLLYFYRYSKAKPNNLSEGEKTFYQYMIQSEKLPRDIVEYEILSLRKELDYTWFNEAMISIACKYQDLILVKTEESKKFVPILELAADRFCKSNRRNSNDPATNFCLRILNSDNVVLAKMLFEIIVHKSDIFYNKKNIVVLDELSKLELKFNEELIRELKGDYKSLYFYLYSKALTEDRFVEIDDYLSTMPHSHDSLKVWVTAKNTLANVQEKFKDLNIKSPFVYLITLPHNVYWIGEFLGKYPNAIQNMIDCYLNCESMRPFVNSLVSLFAEKLPKQLNALTSDQFEELLKIKCEQKDSCGLEFLARSTNIEYKNSQKITDLIIKTLSKCHIREEDFKKELKNFKDYVGFVPVISDETWNQLSTGQQKVYIKVSLPVFQNELYQYLKKFSAFKYITHFQDEINESDRNQLVKTYADINFEVLNKFLPIPNNEKFWIEVVCNHGDNIETVKAVAKVYNVFKEDYTKYIQGEDKNVFHYLFETSFNNEILMYLVGSFKGQPDRLKRFLSEVNYKRLDPDLLQSNIEFIYLNSLKIGELFFSVKDCLENHFLFKEFKEKSTLINFIFTQYNYINKKWNLKKLKFSNESFIKELSEVSDDVVNLLVKLKFPFDYNLELTSVDLFNKLIRPVSIILENSKHDDVQLIAYYLLDLDEREKIANDLFKNGCNKDFVALFVNLTKDQAEKVSDYSFKFKDTYLSIYKNIDVNKLENNLNKIKVKNNTWFKSAQADYILARDNETSYYKELSEETKRVLNRVF